MLWCSDFKEKKTQLFATDGAKRADSRRLRGLLRPNRLAEEVFLPVRPLMSVLEIDIRDPPPRPLLAAT